MSHIVTIQAKLRDPLAIAAACRRLNLPPPTHGTARLYSGEATGLLVQLPDWRYPVVIDVATGSVRYDNFNGEWGREEHLLKLMQFYAVEKTRLEARRKGLLLTETAMADGSIKLQLQQQG